MVKLIALVRRNAGMSQHDFAAYWRDFHAPIAAAIPGMRGYRINVAVDPGDLDPAEFDGSAEIWFDDTNAMMAGLASAEGVLAGADTSRFAAGIKFLVTEETIVMQGPRA